MQRIQRTLDLHNHRGMNCSQAILTAFGEPLGVDPKEAMVLGRPWAGGIGHLAETCGYLTGAVLVLAIALDRPDERLARTKLDRAVEKLFRRFKEHRGSILCRDLLDADMTTECGIKKIMEGQLVEKRCKGKGGIGQEVGEILVELLS